MEGTEGAEGGQGRFTAGRTVNSFCLGHHHDGIGKHMTIFIRCQARLWPSSGYCKASPEFALAVTIE
jgi:hypothetical protein